MTESPRRNLWESGVSDATIASCEHAENLVQVVLPKSIASRP